MKCSLKDIPFWLKNLSEEERKCGGEKANTYTQPAAAQNYLYVIPIMLSPQSKCIWEIIESGIYQLSGFAIKASSVVDWLHQTPDVSYCIWGA